MRHRRFVFRQVNIPCADSALLGRDDPHVDTHLDLRKQHLPRAGPDESGSVSEQQLRLAAERGNDPGVPVKLGVYDGIRDPRTVRRKCRAHFKHVVVRQLYRLAIGK